MKIARYEKRLFGWLIDEAIPVGVWIPVFFFVHAGGPEWASVFLQILYASLADYAAYIILCGLSMIVFKGSTLGMLIFGIRCFNPENGSSIRPSASFLRASLTGIIAMDFLNAVYMLVTHTERSIFDRLTDCLVIDYRRPE